MGDLELWYYSYMSTPFRKFIFVIISLILSYLTMGLLGWIYLNYLVNPGDTFGGELIILLPLGLVGVFVYYHLLKRIFKY